MSCFVRRVACMGVKVMSERWMSEEMKEKVRECGGVECMEEFLLLCSEEQQRLKEYEGRVVELTRKDVVRDVVKLFGVQWASMELPSEVDVWRTKEKDAIGVSSVGLTVRPYRGKLVHDFGLLECVRLSDGEFVSLCMSLENYAYQCGELREMKVWTRMLKRYRGVLLEKGTKRFSWEKSWGRGEVCSVVFVSGVKRGGLLSMNLDVNMFGGGVLYEVWFDEKEDEKCEGDICIGDEEMLVLCGVCGGLIRSALDELRVCFGEFTRELEGVVAVLRQEFSGAILRQKMVEMGR